MRTISSTLLAAAQSLSAQPAIQFTLHSTARRWESVYQQSATTPNKVTAVWVGDTLYRYRIDAGGQLQQQALTDPDADSAWATWSTINNEPSAGMDVAVAYESGRFRVVYQDASKNIRVIEGTDGVTWGAPTAVVSPGSNAYLAAAGQDVLVLTDQLDRYTRGWAGGAWTGPARLAGGPYTLAQGVAAALDATNDELVVLYSLERALRRIAFDRATATWGSSRQIEPRGDAGAPEGASPRYPDILATNGGYVATWESCRSNAPVWAQEVALISADGEHWGHEAPLRVDSALSARLALAQHATTGQIIAGHDTAVLTRDAHTLDDASATTGPLTPVSVNYRVRPGLGATLYCRVIDNDRALDPLSDSDDILSPLNQLVMSRGYVTSAGIERVDLPPLYLTRARRSEGEHGGIVELIAVDALGLLAHLRAWWLAEYQSRSIAWLLSEIAALAGLTCETDGDSAFATALSAWQLDNGQSLADALDDLLAMAGAVAYVDADGIIQATAWDDAPASVGDIGDEDEILGGSVGLSASHASAWPCSGVMIVGDGAAVSLSEDVSAGMSLGLRRLRARADLRATTSALAANLASRERALSTANAAASGTVDEVIVPLRPDLELWDVVDVTLPNGETVQRRVVGIEETWEAGRSEYRSEVRLAAV